MSLQVTDLLRSLHSQTSLLRIVDICSCSAGLAPWLSPSSGHRALGSLSQGAPHLDPRGLGSQQGSSFHESLVPLLS